MIIRDTLDKAVADNAWVDLIGRNGNMTSGYAAQFLDTKGATVLGLTPTPRSTGVPSDVTAVYVTDIKMVHRRRAS